MPTASQHRNKADRNRQFLATVRVDDHPEWAATVAFYVAVHLIEQVRSAAGHGDGRDHQEGLAYVQDHLRPIHSAFQQLYNVSRLARYGATAAFFAQFDSASITDRVIGGWLATVERFVTEQLAQPADDRA